MYSRETRVRTKTLFSQLTKDLRLGRCPSSFFFLRRSNDTNVAIQTIL